MPRRAPFIQDKRYQNQNRNNAQYDITKPSTKSFGLVFFIYIMYVYLHICFVLNYEK